MAKTKCQLGVHEKSSAGSGSTPAPNCTFKIGAREPRDRNLKRKSNALIIRVGFRGPVCYTYNKEPPKIV